MCLPWNHKWETTISKANIDGDRNIRKRCTKPHCGKEIVRKYRV